jgi:hypothetical protein
MVVNRFSERVGQSHQQPRAPYATSAVNMHRVLWPHKEFGVAFDAGAVIEMLIRHELIHAWTWFNAVADDDWHGSVFQSMADHMESLV